MGVTLTEAPSAFRLPKGGFCATRSSCGCSLSRYSRIELRGSGQRDLPKLSGNQDVSTQFGPAFGACMG